MKRTLLSTLVITSTLGLSPNVFALGMGELELKSTLNQPLQAEIELTNIDDLSEWEIKPSLASDGDFDRAGVEKIFFLSDIDFEVKGSRLILSSDKSVTEPFLNFLVQVNWPSGRVLREYTLLLDPPVFDEEIQPLASQQQIQRVETQAVAPAVAKQAPTNNWEKAAAPGTYKVQKDDTLWEIAINTRPSRQVSPQQMMLAIQDSNPSAFINGNINRLKTHQILRIPSQQQMAARNDSQAVSEVLRQNRELKTAGAQLDATAKAGQSNKVTPPAEGGELKLLSSTNDVSNSAGASGDIERGGEGGQEGLQNDLAIALETLDTSKLENQELKDRLASLEEQIATLQRLVSLKDDQLASIQTMDLQQESAEAATENEIESAAVEGVSEELIAEETVADPGAELDEGLVQEETDFNYSDDTASAEVVDTETDSAVEEAAVVEEPAQEVVPTAEEVNAALAANQIQQEIENRYKPKGFVDQILAKPEMLAGIAGGFALLLGLIGFALKKRKAKNEGEIEDPELAGFDENFEFNDEAMDESSLDDFEFAEDDVASAEDELNDDLLEGIGSNSEEVDVDEPADTVAQTADIIGEAEIYIAYGRFDQAADLLNNSIEQEPSRLDLRLKLLEVHVESDDATAFAESELALNAIGDADANAKAATMRGRLSSPIDGAMESDDSTVMNTDLMSENAPEMGIESLADADDEFAGGIDFEAALDFTDGDDDITAEGTDFAASLDALDGMMSESEDTVAADIDGGLEFDLSEPELSLEDIPTLDEAPELDDVLDLDEVATLDEVDILDEVPTLDEAPELTDVPTLDDLDEVPTLDDLSDLDIDLEAALDADDSIDAEGVDLDGLSDLADLDVSEDDSLDAPTLDIPELEEAPALEVDNVVGLASLENSASDVSSDLSDLESLLDNNDDENIDAGLPDLDFDLDETGFSEEGDAAADLQSLEAELNEQPEEIADTPIIEEPALDEPVLEEPVLADAPLETVADNDFSSEFDLDELEDLPDFTAESTDSAQSSDQEIDLEQLAASDDEFDFLAGTDECATKLDLARAYLDMEDIDGAKELLQEVVAEGNDQQKTDARTLMENIG